MTSKITRTATGLAGLPICKEPQKELLKYYSKVLRSLNKLPPESQYRIDTEKLINERRAIVAESPNPEDIERKIGAGMCEELIEQAEHEMKLIEVMKKYKPWEPLEEKPSQDQWKWPPQ